MGFEVWKEDIRLNIENGRFNQIIFLIISNKFIRRDQRPTIGIDNGAGQKNYLLEFETAEPNKPNRLIY